MSWFLIEYMNETGKCPTMGAWLPMGVICAAFTTGCAGGRSVVKGLIQPALTSVLKEHYLPEEKQIQEVCGKVESGKSEGLHASAGAILAGEVKDNFECLLQALGASSDTAKKLGGATLSADQKNQIEKELSAAAAADGPRALQAILRAELGKSRARGGPPNLGEQAASTLVDLLFESRMSLARTLDFSPAVLAGALVLGDAAQGVVDDLARIIPFVGGLVQVMGRYALAEGVATTLDEVLSGLEDIKLVSRAGVAREACGVLGRGVRGVVADRMTRRAILRFSSWKSRADGAATSTALTTTAPFQICAPRDDDERAKLRKDPDLKGFCDAIEAAFPRKESAAPSCWLLADKVAEAPSLFETPPLLKAPKASEATSTTPVASATAVASATPGGPPGAKSTAGEPTGKDPLREKVEALRVAALVCERSRSSCTLGDLNRAASVVLVHEFHLGQMGEIQAQMERLDHTLGSVDARLSGMERRLETLDARLSGVERHLETMERSLAGMPSLLDLEVSRNQVDERSEDRDRRTHAILLDLAECRNEKNRILGERRSFAEKLFGKSATATATPTEVWQRGFGADGKVTISLPSKDLGDLSVALSAAVGGIEKVSCQWSLTEPEKTAVTAIGDALCTAVEELRKSPKSPTGRIRVDVSGHTDGKVINRTYSCEDINTHERVIGNAALGTERAKAVIGVLNTVSCKGDLEFHPAAREHLETECAGKADRDDCTRKNRRVELKFSNIGSTFMQCK